MSAPEDMLQLALKTLPLAYAPYSNFHVAACVRTKDGQLFASGNIENGSYPISSCAEQNAIIKAVSCGQLDIIEVLILVDQPTLCSPCGGCRQCISEFAKSNTPIHLCTKDGLYQLSNLGELLPMTFNLNPTETL
jgi:cytidine deaminase